VAVLDASLLDSGVLDHSLSLLDHSQTLIADAVTSVTGLDTSSFAVAGQDLVAERLQDGTVTIVPRQDLIQGGEELETVTDALNALGKDLFVFLAATVFVTPAARLLGITPVLGFLLIGGILGPYGLNVFSNTEADIELGDFGILFLLFAEGLNLSLDKIRNLAAFFPLGGAQLLLSTLCVQAIFVFGGTMLFGTVAGADTAFEQLIPLDDAIITPLESPVAAFVLGAAGALSSSAFVLPALADKGWEKRNDGTAALSVLLLQDLSVAPLLVALPLLAGQGPSDSSEITTLALKATVGFGGVLYLGSILLRRVFQVVASSQSTNTFVAATLTVAVGMGIAAEQLGLSSSTGAFAAGVLLAGTNYRAQIQADIRPFEGILLGVFFMTAGASLDPGLVLREWPTVLTGVIGLILVKSSAIFTAGGALEAVQGKKPTSLSIADGARVALLLAGGGEFAFVVFKLAQDLGVIQADIAKVLTAIVILSMSLTPLLAELAAQIGNALEEGEASGTVSLVGYKSSSDDEIDLDALRSSSEDGGEGGMEVPADAIVVCGYGEVGQSVCQALQLSDPDARYAVFDLNPARVAAGLQADVPIIYGDGSSANLLRAAGIADPKAIVVTYAGADRCADTTQKLRAAFPDSPVYTRARTRAELNELYDMGASEVITETTETAAELAAFALDSPSSALELRAQLQAQQRKASGGGLAPGTLPFGAEELEELLEETGSDESEVRNLFATFSSLDVDGTGDVDLDEVQALLMRSRVGGMVDDAAIQEWIKTADTDGDGTIDFREFVRAFAKNA